MQAFADQADLNEAEIQLLASLHALELQDRPVTLDALEQRGEGYWIYREDWKQAYRSLADRKLIVFEDGYARLLDDGHDLAQGCYAERPDYYWYYYQQFYQRADQSAAHSQFCERVYGFDLCQEGMLDMDALHDLLGRLDLNAGQRLLDLGCGAGGIAEYISDRSDVTVTGIDYSSTAIETARQRCRNKASRLKFVEADMNHLELAPRSYDAAIAVDSIYWVGDTCQVIKDIAAALKPGGQLLMVTVHRLEAGDDPASLKLDSNWLTRALDQTGFDYQAVDCSAAFLDFWPRVRQALIELADDFEDEGTGFIRRNWQREADTEFLPARAAGNLRRYLYQLRV